MSEHEHEHGHGHKKTYAYFIGADKYETEEPALTGAQIKARIPNLEPNTGLSLEGHGNDPDRLIGDDEVVRLAFEHGPLHFTLVPPATFG